LINQREGAIMSKRNLVLVLVFALSVWSLPAQAVLQRVYVSAISGNDANTATGCPASAPCRWFSTAVTTVDAGGEVVAMDSGAYGAVTIAKSVSIIGAPGVYAGITVFSGNGVTIATAAVNVVLRGLTINGMGGSSGIYMTNGASLTVDHCAVSNFPTGYGLYVATAAQVTVLDSLMTGSMSGVFIGYGATGAVSRSRFSGNSSVGLEAYQSSAGTTTVSVSQSEASGNNAGFFADAYSGGTARLDVRDSVASGNLYGFVVYPSGGTAQMSVSSSLASGNSSIGLYASGSGATLTAGGSTVTRNGVGLVQTSSAVLESTGDNIVRGNTTATGGTITSVSRM
jgi:hypothetical protein